MSPRGRPPRSGGSGAPDWGAERGRPRADGGAGGPPSGRVGSRPAAKPAGNANPGRVAAARALLAVEQGGHVEDALPALLPPDGPDRSLAWLLAFTVLRRQGQIDGALRAVLTQPVGALDAEVRVVLRLAAAEALFLRTPRYAAVDQAVETVRALGMGRAARLVNAVARRVEAQDGLPRADALDHPAWLVARWDARYGADATSRWCTANGEPPPLFLVARGAPDALAARLSEAGVACRPAELAGQALEGVLRVDDRAGRVEDLPGFAEGAFWVQDAASVWMTDLVPAGADRVLDACAAPGGKSFRLASRGARVLATDVSAERLERLGESATRLQLPVLPLAHDWTAGPREGIGRFDAVLVDAPCTGLGTVRRRPEIRWRRGPMDPSLAAEKQGAILRSAGAHVAPGGALVYVVCSPEPEEGEQVVSAFLTAHSAFKLDEVRSSAPPSEGEDAFWGARLVRA
jgi:16S rRNA (cytosine967-C5)-methyltransferase